MRVALVAILLIFLSTRTLALHCCQTLEFEELSVKNPSMSFSCDLTKHRISGFLFINEIEIGRIDSEIYLIHHQNLGCLGSFKLGNTLKIGGFYWDDGSFVTQIFGYGEGYHSAIGYNSEEVQMRTMKYEGE